MDADAQPKYACPHCGATEYITEPDGYSLYQAEDDKLFFARTLDVHEEFRLYCRECGEEPPQAFLDATHPPG